MTPTPDPTPEFLLEHGAFLRRIARSLVIDEHGADDVVQATYLAVLRRPPPAGVRLRAWLATIARNLSLRTLRTRGRVRRREQAAARPEGYVADDIAERVEIQRRVADAVARLPEPGRSAIVRRYFDGLTSAELARLDGVPLRTIESRLRRARERLRAELDGAYGARAAWQAALLPVAGLGAHGTLSTATSSIQAATPTAASAGALFVAGATIMQLKTTVALAFLVALGAFFAGRTSAPEAPAPISADLPGEAREASAPVLEADRAIQARLQGELEAARSDNAALRAELEALKARAHAEPRTSPSELDAAGGDRSSVYGPAAHRKALEAQDWGKAGEAVAKLLPLLDTLTASLATGAELDQTSMLDIPKWNSPLQALAIDLVQKGVPGTGANGSFSHPAVSVNLVRATLEQGGLPLSADQHARLNDMGDRFVQEDERRQVGYGEGVLKLQMLLDEAALKDRFYAEIDAMLTEAQVNLLHPPAVRGRLGVDLFSSGIVWHTVAKPVQYKDVDDLARSLARTLMAQYKFTDEERPVIDDAAAAWARSFSPEDLAASADKVYVESAALTGGLASGWARVDVVRRAAQHTLALKRTLLDRLPIDSAGATALRDGPPRLALPLRK